MESQIIVAPPPQNLEAEQSVLGAILFDTSILGEIANLIAPDDFYQDAHRHIFLAMKELAKAGTSIDVITLPEQLKKSGALQRAGGASYIVALVNTVPNAANVSHHCRIVKKLAKSRILKHIAVDILREIEEGTLEPELLIEETAQALKEIAGTPRQKLWGSLREYIEMSAGVFSTQDLRHHFNLRERKDNNNLSQALHKLCKEGVIERAGQKNGFYRKVDKSLVHMNLKDAKRGGEFDIELPLGLNSLVRVLPKNIIIVAGFSNAGKSAMMMNIIHKNIGKYPMRYMNSEAGEQEMAERLDQFGESPEYWDGAEFVEKSGQFNDIIIPDGLNLIDYLKPDPDRPYMVVQDIEDIFNKLTTGVAVIAIQKRKGVSHAVGGEGSLALSRLYLTMDDNIITIQKGKIWRTSGYNPNGMWREYKLINGCKFKPVDEWHHGDEEQPTKTWDKKRYNR